MHNRKIEICLFLLFDVQYLVKIIMDTKNKAKIIHETNIFAVIDVNLFLCY